MWTEAVTDCGFTPHWSSVFQRWLHTVRVTYVLILRVLNGVLGFTVLGISACSPSLRAVKSTSIRQVLRDQKVSEASRCWMSSAGAWQWFKTVNAPWVVTVLWASEHTEWENDVWFIWSWLFGFLGGRFVVCVRVCACVGLLGELVTGRLIHWTGWENVKVTPNVALHLHLLWPCAEHVSSVNVRDCMNVKQGAVRCCHYSLCKWQL